MVSELGIVLFLNGYSPLLLKAAYYASQSLYVMIPLVLLLVVKERGISSGIYRTCALAVVYVAETELKMLFNIPRPADSQLTFLDIENDSSFPSGHASGSFGASAVSGHRIFYVWALLISASRIVLGVHYLTDVMAGAVLGYVIGAVAVRYERRAVEIFLSGRHAFETGRKLFHGFFGVAVAGFVYLAPKDIAAAVLLLSIIISLLVSFAIKNNLKTYIFDWLISTFERKKDIKNFPLKGSIFFLLGALISVILYRTDIAATSVIILALGDCFSTLVGKPLGKTRHPHNAGKSLEGSAAGLIAALAGAVIFAPGKIALIGAFVGIIIESFNLKFFGVGVDDNLSIPVISGAVMTAAVLFGV